MLFSILDVQLFLLPQRVTRREYVNPLTVVTGF